MTLPSQFPATPVETRIRPRFARIPVAPLLLMFAVGLLFVIDVPLSTGAKASSGQGTVASATQSAYAIPTRPVDGELLIVIPPGTAEVMRAGGVGYLMPSVINLEVGDTIVIRNEDTDPHIIMFAFVLPGETIARVMDHPLTETYSAGCTISPTPVGFTSLFVRER